MNRKLQMPGIKAAAVGTAVLLLLSGAPVLAAQSVAISHSGDSDDTWSVVVEEATADEVLEELGPQAGFTFVRSGKADAEATISGSFQGSLKEVLPRILRNEDYVLIHGGEQKIERIVLLNTKAQPGVMTPPPPAPTSTPERPALGFGDEPEQGPVASSGTPSRVTELLQSQALQQHPEILRQHEAANGFGDANAEFGGNEGQSSSQPRDQAELMRELTQRAHQDVQALVKSLEQATKSIQEQRQQ